MANEYAVNRADLAAVADAIRTKGGTSGALTFPGGFVDAVEGIQTGGSDNELLDLVQGTMTEINNEQLTTVRESAFQRSSKLKIVNLPNVTSLGDYALNSCAALETVILPKVTSLGREALAYSKIKNELVMESLTTTVYAMQYFRNSNIAKARFPKLNVFAGQIARYSATFGILDLPVCTEIGVANFENASSNYCSHLLLRADSVCAVSTINTGILNVYVPSALIEEYKVATNWVDLYTSNPNLFHALEDYTVDGTISGEFDESKI